MGRRCSRPSPTSHHSCSSTGQRGQAVLLVCVCCLSLRATRSLHSVAPPQAAPAVPVQACDRHAASPTRPHPAHQVGPARARAAAAGPGPRRHGGPAAGALPAGAAGAGCLGRTPAHMCSCSHMSSCRPTTALLARSLTGLCPPACAAGHPPHPRPPAALPPGPTAVAGGGARVRAGQPAHSAPHALRRPGRRRGSLQRRWGGQLSSARAGWLGARRMAAPLCAARAAGAVGAAGKCEWARHCNAGCQHACQYSAAALRASCSRGALA